MVQKDHIRFAEMAARLRRQPATALLHLPKTWLKKSALAGQRRAV